MKIGFIGLGTMPLANLAKEVYLRAMQEGYGDKDFSAIYSYLAKETGR